MTSQVLISKIHCTLLANQKGVTEFSVLVTGIINFGKAGQIGFGGVGGLDQSRFHFFNHGFTLYV